jgi:hypothetical protein
MAIALRYSLCALVVLFVLQASLSAQAAAAGYGDYPGFEVRYGSAVEDVTKGYRALVDNPTVIQTVTRQFADPLTGITVLEGRGDAHVVFAIPIEAFAATLEVSDDQVKFAPGVLDARVEERDGPRVIVYQLVGTNFLGIKVAFPTRSEVVRDELPDGALGFRARLIESLDHRLYESYSSWYLLPITVDGKPMLYVRTYMCSGICNPFVGMESLLRAFMPSQISNMFHNNLREARKRQAK